MTARGHFRDVITISAGADVDAVAQARGIASAVHGFELWQQDRLVHRESRNGDSIRTELGRLN